MEGDTLIGRQTIPIVHPKLAAPTLAMVLQAWSVGLSILWHANLVTGMAINTLALAVGLCFLLSKTCHAYQRSFYLYNVSSMRPSLFCLVILTWGVSGMVIFRTWPAVVLEAVLRFSGSKRIVKSSGSLYSTTDRALCPQPFPFSYCLLSPCSLSVLF